MSVLTAKPRDKKETLATLRKEGFLPLVLYGVKTKNLALKVDLKEFKKIYQEAGESSLISLKIEGDKEESMVLIHDTQFHPLSDEIIHADLYKPDLKKETEAAVPLEFIGESLAVKNLEGTLIKNIQEVEVKALPQNLPHEIRVDVSKLETFEDNILIKDLVLPEGVEVLKDEAEIIVSVAPPTKVEEELEKPIEEKVDEVEKVEEKKEEEEEGEEEEK